MGVDASAYVLSFRCLGDRWADVVCFCMAYHGKAPSRDRCFVVRFHGLVGNAVQWARDDDGQSALVGSF